MHKWMQLDVDSQHRAQACHCFFSGECLPEHGRYNFEQKVLGDSLRNFKIWKKESVFDGLCVEMIEVLLSTSLVPSTAVLTQGH